MIPEKNKKTAQWAMDFALKHGCRAARLHLYHGSNTSFEIRNMKIDRLQQSSESALSIHLFVDGRYGSFSTNRLDRKELEKFIRNGIDSTRYLAEDPARTLPDASLYYRGGDPDLQLYDAQIETVPPDDKVALAMHTCDEIMGQDARIVAAEASYGDGDSFRYMIASNGFEGESSSSYFSLSGSASIKGDGDARPADYWYDSALYYDTLRKKGIGTKALERALQKLGQKKIASARMPMVVDAMNSRRLLTPVVNALYGSAIQQKNSFMLDRLDVKTLGDRMTLTDEPHRTKASGARYFDGEGVATRQMPVFDAGVLKTYYIDTCYANRMATARTVDSPSILIMPRGGSDLEGLIASMDRGILVTGFNGGNCSTTTGDFSYGIEGFLIEKGRRVQPVHEMNITGNMLTLWNRLADVGNDPLSGTSWRIPSLLFEEVNFSGV
ncbi:MAG: TldD/PmbA family protein [Tannerella sp.]|jgi:PmbA protein|nr:TldD/PmbA family protein [Tannerella sp.]